MHFGSSRKGKTRIECNAHIRLFSRRDQYSFVPDASAQVTKPRWIWS
jgi:hypothetical protein